ncbi:MAG TPA: class IV adenylate cyclase [Anaerolineales bacterium]
MKTEEGELEVKFYLSQRKKLEERLAALGGRVIAPRVHEVNLRFDTPDMSLLASGRLLRLRQDSRARLTYKGAGSELGGARLRQELEITVSDFDTTRSLIEALGFQLYMMYEKYRTTYAFDKVEAVFDEMPTGDFLEIEGPDGDYIQAAAHRLGLSWERRILDSYTVLFERTRSSLGFAFRDLSFENFKGLKVTPEALGISYADTE